jgi:NAD(P)-dependent dehydrogenase (short-subunit alcohol dehydrogenase family)
MTTTKRIALITGANKGIGLETARQLGRQGITVLIGARDVGRGEAAAESLRKERIDARFVHVDVTDQRTLDAAGKLIERDFGRLDILVNNAAVQVPGDRGNPSAVPVEIYRQTFESNFFGLIAVTRAMLPLVRKSAAGRIVNLTSILGSLAEHSDPYSTIYNVTVPAYDTSKAAVNLLTVELAHELRGTKIKVNAAHPGWVKTDMGGEMAPLELEEGAKTSVWLATLPDDGPTGGFFHLTVHMRW